MARGNAHMGGGYQRDGRIGCDSNQIADFQSDELHQVAPAKIGWTNRARVAGYFRKAGEKET
jgi:hypothetical protein